MAEQTSTILELHWYVAFGPIQYPCEIQEEARETERTNG